KALHKLKWSSTQKGKFRFKDWHLWGAGGRGSGYPNLTGTRSHFRSDCLGDRKRKVSSLPVVFWDM
ncbi:unnamed protein product, partial [Staurois parvus]